MLHRVEILLQRLETTMQNVAEVLKYPFLQKDLKSSSNPPRHKHLKPMVLTCHPNDGVKRQYQDTRLHCWWNVVHLICNLATHTTNQPRPLIAPSIPAIYGLLISFLCRLVLIFVMYLQVPPIQHDSWPLLP